MRVLDLKELNFISGGFMSWEASYLFHAGVKGEDISSYCYNQAMIGGAVFGAITAIVLIAYDRMNALEASLGVALGGVLGVLTSVGRVQYRYYLGTSFADSMNRMHG